MKNERAYDRIYPAYNFSIECNDLHFRASRVRSIEQEVELEEVREGGENHYVHLLVKPPSKSKRLVFERGYSTEPIGQKLEKMLGEYQSEPLSIFIYDRTGSSILKTYRIMGWMPVRWQLSGFDASDGKILIETIELAYQVLDG